MEAIDFNFSGSITPITDGHRLLSIIKENGNSLYAENDYRKKSSALSVEFVLSKIIPSLISSMEQNVSHKITAAALRASKNLSCYGVKKIGYNEISTEILFDPKLTKVIEKNTSRKFIHEKIKTFGDLGRSVGVGLPLFSRKPVSPIKNRGFMPDLGDINSLIRCAEISKMLSWVNDRETKIDIFSDGFKYQRACGTPDYIIKDYQMGLKFWVNQLGINDSVNIVDYEESVKNKIGLEKTLLREEVFDKTYKALSKQTEKLFNPDYLLESITKIESMIPHGKELRCIFLSIVSNKFYHSENLGVRLLKCQDESQVEYVNYLNELNYRLKGFCGKNDKNLHSSLIIEAWDAALKYISISLTDRKLNIWDSIHPEGIKLTIHGKPEEIQIKPTNSSFPSLTSQHSTGGIKLTNSGIKITNEYRIEREASNEIPVLFERPTSDNSSNKDIPRSIMNMIEIEQPFFYAPENIGDLYRLLSGRYIDA